MVKVSIIVPVYNVEKYLEKCLKSLINQTLKDIEIILVNDGSQDNSQKIIDKYVKTYPKLIKSFIKENGGQGSARNYGIEQSKGKYIIFVDSDDYIEDTMVDSLYKKIKENNSDIVICGNSVVNENYEIIKTELPKTNNIKNYSKTEAIFDKMAVWNKIYRKDLILNNNIKFRSNVWYEDLDFTMKIILLSSKIDIVNNSLYNYLLRQGSTMNNSNINRNLEILDAFNEVLYFCKNKKIYKEYYSEIEFLAIDHIYISAIVRVILADADKNEKHHIISELRKYMETNFNSFKKNKYIKNLPFNRKTIYLLSKYKLYDIIYLMFKIKSKLKG